MFHKGSLPCYNCAEKLVNQIGLKVMEMEVHKITDLVVNNQPLPEL